MGWGSPNTNTGRGGRNVAWSTTRPGGASGATGLPGLPAAGGSGAVRVGPNLGMPAGPRNQVTPIGGLGPNGSRGPAVGGAPGGNISSGQNIQANPFLSEAFGYFRDLWNRAGDLSKETYNKEPAIQDYQRMRAQGLKEIQANAGRQGFGPGTGMTVSQMGGYGRDTEQGAQGLAGNLWNAGLNQRTNLLNNMASILGGMGGVGSSIAGNQAQLAGLGLQANRDAVDAWYKTNMLPIEMERARNQIAIANISAAGQIAGML